MIALSKTHCITRLERGEYGHPLCLKTIYCFCFNKLLIFECSVGRKSKQICVTTETAVVVSSQIGKIKVEELG